MKPLIEEIVRSLRDNPEDWRLSDSYLTHKSRVRLGWSMAKGAYAPVKGNLWVEYNSQQGETLLSNRTSVNRWLDLSEHDVLWRCITDCKAAEELKDKLLLDKLKGV